MKLSAITFLQIYLYFLYDYQSTSHAIAYYCARVHGDVIFLFDAFYIPFYMPLRVGLFCATVFYATLLRFLYGFFCAWELLCLRAGKTDPKTVSGAASLRFPYDFFDATSQRFFHVLYVSHLCLRGKFFWAFSSIVFGTFPRTASTRAFCHFRRISADSFYTSYGGHFMCDGTLLTANTLCAAAHSSRRTPYVRR
jgi:hypothetical protein